MFDCIKQADPTAEVETIGLVEHRPNRRPADILTGCAFAGTLASLDMCIASPHASASGRDCCAAGAERKFREYAEELPHLEQQGIKYVPMVWSCYGREHADVTKVLTNVARRAARRNGLVNHGALLSRFRQKLGVALWRRAARMLFAVASAGGDDL